jgi:hypothetical protein
MLPEKPKELQSHEEVIEFMIEIRNNQKKNGIDYWINKAEDYEGYYFYLADILEEYNLEFLSFEDYNKEEKQGITDYWKNIEKLKADYRDLYIDKVNKIELT